MAAQQIGALLFLDFEALAIASPFGFHEIQKQISPCHDPVSFGGVNLCHKSTVKRQNPPRAFSNMRLFRRLVWELLGVEPEGGVGLVAEVGDGVRAESLLVDGGGFGDVFQGELACHIVGDGVADIQRC